ncbi:unnamed protein product [Symbiodinium natans]|uniref:Uncharacterized protein n=1 Tax=Symbiodinium natans TaxID=878477 RepID=A0A812PRE8_9DINO|nr:unnamed protein product [Symbiodinium natans]
MTLPKVPTPLALAECLRSLANDLERCSDPAKAEGAVEARQGLQRTLATCWAGRPLPPACAALRDLLGESALDADVEVKIVKPNGESSFVGMILRKGVAEAVVKYRGEFPSIAFREECNYVFADWLGFHDVVAPCIALDLPLASSEFTDLSVMDVLRKHTAVWAQATQEHCKTWPTNMWVTVEKCIRIAESESSRGPASRLANFFGSVDLRQAYAATPSGQCCGIEALLRDTYTRQQPTDADFFKVVSNLDVQNVHRLCVCACITMQRDGGPSNLMLRQARPQSPQRPQEGEDSCEPNSGNSAFELVCIDSTRVLNAFPSEAMVLFDELDGTIGPFTYWFPACVELPQSEEVLHPSVASAVLSLDADAMEGFLAQLLSFPGASLARSKCEALAASDRLRHMQSLLGEEPEITARELCFRVMPLWEADYWAPGRKELIPFHELGVHLHEGGSAEEWGERCSWPHSTEHASEIVPVSRPTVNDFF